MILLIHPKIHNFDQPREASDPFVEQLEVMEI